MRIEHVSLSLINWLNRRRKAFRHFQLQLILKNQATLSYTSDWLSPHLDIWRCYLEPLMGQENIHGLEIGSYEGRSAIWLLEHVLSHASSTLTCIDPFLRSGSEARFDHNISIRKLAGRLNKLRGYSQDILPKLTPHSFDLIYIDGSHASGNVLLDAFLSWPLLKRGGVIIFDDYLLKRESHIPQRPKLAIDLFLKYHDQDCEVLYSGYQIIMKKKPRVDAFLIAG